MSDSFYGIALDDAAGAEDGSERAGTADMVEVFEFLRPKRNKAPLIRIGGDQDGSYLVPDDLDGIAACFSPGVNRIKHFEDSLGDVYGITSHMCDFTCDVSEFTTPLREGVQTFQKKWLDPEPGADNISLGDWVRANSAAGDLLLQMDIEGAEFRNVLGTSDDVLARFRVVVLEVHGLRQLVRAAVLDAAVAPFVAKLGRHFTTVHAHPNNCCGEFTIPGTDIRVPDVLELTLVRHDRFVPVPGPPALPHPLDVARNVAHNAPLFLSEAWCGRSRPLESRVKMLEDTLAFRDAVDAVTDRERAGLRSLVTQALHTSNRLLAGPLDEVALTEVAAGRPYTLSSAHASSRPTGTVGARGNFFFSTALGTGQFIRIDLGTPRRVRRIELTNRRDGLQDRAEQLFVSLSGEAGSAASSVFPVGATGDWQECAVPIPDVAARYVTITAPLHTALHLADVRVLAVDATASSPQPAGRPAARRPRHLARRPRHLAAAARRRLARRVCAVLTAARDR